MSFVGRAYRAWAGGTLLSALCLSAGGCSSGDDAAAPVNADEFITELCADFEPCCAAAGLPADAARCRGIYETVIPREGYDSAAAGACLAEIRSLKDKCGGSEATPSCDRVFRGSGGTKQPGEECESASDCATPNEGTVLCDFTGDSTARKCQVVLTGKNGSSPCVATIFGNVWIGEGSFESSGYSCNAGAGLACDAVSRECRPLANAGEKCVGGNYCVASAYCDRADSTCRPRDANGEACQDGSCVVGHYCGDAGACVDQLKDGAVCTQSVQCLSNSCENGKCEGRNDAAEALLCGSN
jgi:hypothetical protein